MLRHVVSTSFIIAYGACFAFVAFQVYAMLRDKHKMRGYQAFFNYYTLTWALLRTLYWAGFASDAAFVTQNSVFSYLLYFMPLCFQLLTFALLATFLVKLVCGAAAWAGGVRTRMRAAQGVLAAVSLMGTAVLAFLSALVSDAFYRYWLLGNAVLFLLLALGYLALALRVRGVPEAEFSRMLLSKASLGGVTAAITAVFASRSIYDFLSFKGLVVIDINRDDLSTDVACAVMYGVWEFFPLVLLLSTLAAGPQRAGGGRGGEGGLRMPTFGVFGAIAALAEQGVGASGEQPLLEGGEALLLDKGGEGGGGAQMGGEGGGGVCGGSGALRRLAPSSSGTLSEGGGGGGAGSARIMSHLNLSALAGTPLASPALQGLGGSGFGSAPLLHSLNGAPSVTPLMRSVGMGGGGAAGAGLGSGAPSLEIGALQPQPPGLGGGLGVSGGVLAWAGGLGGRGLGPSGLGAVRSPQWMQRPVPAESEEDGERGFY